MATPNVYDERFEASPGYDVANDGETVSGTATITPDKATTGQPNWGNECLEVAAGNDEAAYYDLLYFGSLAISYFRFEIQIVSELLGNGNIGRLISVWDHLWSEAFRLYLYQDGSGNLKFQISSYHDGASNAYIGFPTLSTGVVYRVEIKWDATNDLWAWRIDGVDQPNDQDATDPVESEGILSSAHVTNVDNMAVGTWQWDNGYTAYFDLVGIDNSDWIGAEAAGSILPLVGHSLGGQCNRMTG